MLISKRRREPAHYMLKIESFSLLSEDPQMKIKSDIFEASDADENTTKLHEKKTEWGFEKLIPLEFFKDSENGYLLNDSCVFGAEVFVVPEYAAKDRCLTMIKPPSNMSTHTWKIDNFSAATGVKLQSEIFKIGKIKWTLSLYPKGHYKGGLGTHITLFLSVHDAVSLSDDWKVYADFTFRIKCQKGSIDKVRAIRHWFCPSSVSCGFRSFLELSEVTNAANGYLLNDTLIVAVKISCIGEIEIHCEQQLMKPAFCELKIFILVQNQCA
ncbi:MATH domain and coiled-coil domain-containing protein At2g05410-like [Rutidosis leptorrhynchoides]|uniref:MATH domain and coiled-coil domain-containing protein At2g05410-like n=1 Tax=Rutidosis leptorrhynchoides TaxID=125765 RepID=UPI003A9928C4